MILILYLMIRDDFLICEEFLIHAGFIGLTVKEKSLTEHDGLIGIINAFNNGCQNPYEMADYLNVVKMI